MTESGNSKPTTNMTTKYFLDANGARTFRLQGRPGEGHYEIAKHVLAQPAGPAPATESEEDVAAVYEAMFRAGYVRVVETAQTLEYEAPRKLTSGQSRFFEGQKRSGKTVRQVASPERLKTRSGTTR